MSVGFRFSGGTFEFQLGSCKVGRVWNKPSQSIGLSVKLTYGDGVGVALVVDAEPPQALIGRTARVAILHPEVGRRGHDEKHEGGHAAERASPCQRVEHGVGECSPSAGCNC